MNRLPAHRNNAHPVHPRRRNETMGSFAQLFRCHPSQLTHRTNSALGRGGRPDTRRGACIGNSGTTAPHSRKGAGGLCVAAGLLPLANHMNSRLAPGPPPILGIRMVGRENNRHGFPRGPAIFLLAPGFKTAEKITLRLIDMYESFGSNMRSTRMMRKAIGRRSAARVQLQVPVLIFRNLNN